MRHLATLLTFLCVLAVVYATAPANPCTDANGVPTCHQLAVCLADGATCECQPGTRGDGTSDCDPTGFAFRYVVDGELESSDNTRRADLPSGFTNDNVLSTFCPDDAEGWFMSFVDTDRYSSDLAFTEVFCIYATEEDAQDGMEGFTLPSGYTVTAGPRVYRWQLPTTGAPIQVPPTGMEVDNVFFDRRCATSGCWVIQGVLTTGENLWNNNAFNTFFLPHAVGDQALSYDFDYSAGGNGASNDVSVEWTFQPANHPCSSVGFESTAAGNTQEVTTCCITNPGIGESVSGNKGGFLANYRPTLAFEDWADETLAECSGANGQIIQSAAYTGTETWNVAFPTNAVEFISATTPSYAGDGGKFQGMPDSPGIVNLTVTDPFFGQYFFEIRLDEVELRTKAGKLKGTVGVEHTVDTFLGLANFRATGIEALDTFATQIAIHVEKTNFFTVSTHGTNDYTFLEYVNMRLIAIYEEDSDFSGSGESAAGTVRTNSAAAAHYVQVTFTLGSKYGVNAASGGLIPLDSVRAGEGTFIDDAVLDHKCQEWEELGSYTFDDKNTFEERLDQSCAPASTMCSSPEEIPDSFVSFNIPLGIDFYNPPSSTLSNNIFVDMVINAIDTEAQESDDMPNDGNDPWQMKTTLTASIPVVEGGVNIFCDGFTAKTDLQDVANVDIVVGSANSADELSRLRIKKDIASTQLDSSAITEINSDSIEDGLMTLVLKGNASYFETNNGRQDVSLELEDLITIHIMEDDGTGDDANGVSQSVLGLITAAPADNSDSNGLDTDGYNLNGAFYFTIDRSAQRAHLEPLQALLNICPFNPPRPSGSTPLETCVIRRDVRYRGFPARTGAKSTAMEICNTDPSTAGVCTSSTTSNEANFFVTIFGDNDYARDLAVSFASVIDEEYDLNGRYRRAYWINPGYEWTPTQTGGASPFSISQKLYLFALITLDEGVSDDNGKAGASPTLTRRRMLLQTSTADQLKDGQATVGSQAFEFSSTPKSIMANAFKVPEDRVATFAVKLQLTQAEACMEQYALQAALQGTFDDYLSGSASQRHTVQVTKMSVDKADVQCRRSLRSLLSSFSAATAEVTMLIVFKEGTQSTFSLEKFSTMDGVLSIEPLDVSGKVNVEAPVTYVPPPPIKDESSGSSSNVALIAGVVGGVGGALLVAIVIAVVYMRKGREQEPIQAIQTINVDNLKAQLSQDV